MNPTPSTLINTNQKTNQRNIYKNRKSEIQTLSEREITSTSLLSPGDIQTPSQVTPWWESQHAGTATLRGYFDFLPFYQFPQKVMPHVTVLRIRLGNRVLCDLNGTLLILIHDNARHPSLRQHETPNLPQKQNILPHVRHSHILRLSSRESHTVLRLGVP